jgi:hypothetical protein
MDIFFGGVFINNMGNRIFVFDFGVFIHILFVMALFIMLFEVIREENK